MAEAYDFTAVERKWQERWASEGTYEVAQDDPRPAYYVLCMYPYPSGRAHMGHVRNYTFGDLIVRHRTMNGQAVLSGVAVHSARRPAENAATQAGVRRRRGTDVCTKRLMSSLKASRAED